MEPEESMDEFARIARQLEEEMANEKKEDTSSETTTEQTSEQEEDDVSLAEREPAEAQIDKETREAVELHRMLLDPQTAPLAVKEIMRWAKEQGYIEEAETATKPEHEEEHDTWQSIWGEPQEKREYEELARRIEELEAQLRREQEQKAIQMATRYVLDLAQKDQTALSREEARKIVDEARRFVRPDMDDRTVAEILELCYNRAVTRRQKAEATRRAVAPKEKAEVNVQPQASVSSDYEARVESIIRKYLKT